MNEILELATDIAREAGDLARARFSEPRHIETKSTAIDLVTDVDRAADALIRSRVAQARPGDGLLTEEDTEIVGTSGLRWVIDPIDGTTNYAHGFPHYAVSIGVEQDGKRAVGVIYDPMKNEMFSAIRGAGAFLNGEPIQVSGIDTLERALLGTGFAYDVHASGSDNLDNFARFIKRAQAVRRAGAAALDLAYVACGRFDGFWELTLHPWDVAAGILIVEEAGGRTSDLDGGATPSSGARIVASNGKLHDAMLELLA